MIVYSDNNALQILVGAANPDEIDKVYANMNIKGNVAEIKDEMRAITTYASFFRVLYNASYLNKNMSERALALLSESDFKEGILRGVPPAVTVAHKFGEYADGETNTMQLHECGIVYYPRHPYLLCIMTKGPDFYHLKEVISLLSFRVFNEVGKQHSLEHAVPDKG